MSAKTKGTLIVIGGHEDKKGDRAILKEVARRATRAKDCLVVATIATGYPREVAEQALAHALRDKVEAAYRRGDMLEKRRRLMEEWALVCRAALFEGVEGTGASHTYQSQLEAPPIRNQ